MARIRTIKPEFWTSEQVVSCSRDARLLFIGLWNFSDDAGRHPATPGVIKMKILPGDELTHDDIRRMLDELSSNGLIELYEVENQQFLRVTGWFHQKIDRPQPPKYPAPGTIIRRALVEHSSADRKGKEGKGRDREILNPDPALVTNPARDAGPSDFTPTTEKPRLDDQTQAKLDLAKRMIGHLDGCRAELWHDDTMARAKPHRLDLPTALGWIDAGADEALVIGVLEAVLDRQHSAGDLPADSLRYFDRPVREALAARGGQAEAETPRRELTEEEGDRIRLDTWVKMSPGHGDRDDAWYSMRYPRPTPEQVAEARRRLGFDPPTVDPASGQSP